MIDIQFVRENPELVAEKSRQKGIEVDVTALLELDKKLKVKKQEADDLRQKRNEHAAALKGGKPSSDQVLVGKEIKEQLSKIDAEIEPISQKYNKLLKTVPNMPLDDVPVGSSEKDNVVIKTIGEPRKFDFEPKSHEELGKQLGWIDKERAAKISGSRFVFLKGDLVKLQFALINWVISLASDTDFLNKLIKDNGLSLKPTPYIPVIPPVILKTDTYEATGRLKAEEMTYKLSNDELWLVGSAEHSMCAMYQNETINAEDLPLRYIGYSTSFRREAGSYGQDVSGIIRLHHFDKLEFEVFSSEDTSLEEHKLLIAFQEYLVSSLDLPYRVVNKCTADIGDPNARGVDIDVWVPSQKVYRETHSADYMTDYQARGLNTRYKENDKTKLVHTNDATAFALGRIMAFIMENNQQKDGSVKIPDVLKDFYGG